MPTRHTPVHRHQQSLTSQLALPLLLTMCLSLAHGVSAVDTPDLLHLDLLLSDGSHIIGTTRPATTSVETCYANIQLPLHQIAAIQHHQARETTVITMQNGDEMHGICKLAPLPVETILGKFAIDLALIRTLRIYPASTGAWTNALSWDPTKEFSDTFNPCGVWSYGWTPALGSAFTLFRAHRTEANLDGWIKGEPDYPAVWINHTNRVYDGVRPGELSLHPNLSSECAVLRWTAPKTCRLALKGTFGAGDAGAMHVYVLHNDTPCFQVLETRRDEPFALELRVATGDRVDFVVGPGRAGHGWGNIPLAVTIAAH
jgi:hypothetical protein